MDETGLSEGEARRIRALVGPNRLSAPPTWQLIWSELRRLTAGPAGLLLLAALISACLGRLRDAVAIALAVAMGALIDAHLSWQSRTAIRELGRLVVARCRVLRDSRVRVLACEDLVPGDVVVLEPGDRLGADGEILTGRLLLDESLLTGESWPVTRGEGEPVTGGTWVRSGRGLMRVSETGCRSRIGRLGGLVQELQLRAAPVQQRLDRIGVQLMGAAIALSSLLVVAGLVRGQDLSTLLEAAIVLTVAAIPEALPSVATIALAHVSLGLARQGFRIQNLPAIETLGRVNVLAFDKTGTLTTQHIQLQEWIPPEPGGSPAVAISRDTAGCGDAGQGLLDAARLACVLFRAGDGRWQGDPLDQAIAELVSIPGGIAAVVSEHEPSPDEPWSEVWRGLSVYRKGAPEILLARATRVDGRPLDSTVRELWEERARALGASGARILGVSRSEASGPEDWLGLLAFRDPIRSDARAVVERATALGIEVWMLTGDHDSTARAIARAVGLSDAKILSRATPGSKLAWIRERQARGDVVAMTGDGVNDAPALAQAAVGIAMVSGTDVARETSDGVLTAGSLDPLVTACEAGRRIHHRLQQAIDYLLTCSLTTMACALMAVLAGFPQPLYPSAILYLNLLTHVWPALAIATRSDHVDVRQPVSGTGPVLGPGRLVAMSLHVVTMAAAALLAGMSGRSSSDTRALIFATLATSLLAHVVVDTSRRPFGGWRELGALGWLWVAGGLAIFLPLTWSTAATWLSLGVLDWQDWPVVLGAASAATCAGEIVKAFSRPEGP